MSMSDEERMAAKTGRGLEVAEVRMAAAHADINALASVDHILAAIEALSLHLRHVEEAAELFQREMQYKSVRRLPRVGPDELETGNVA